MDRIQIIGGGRPAIPEGFRARLRALDPSLLVTWNDRRRRFVIEQCVRHLATGPEHTHVCQRSYVYLVQDDQGAMLPLGDHVIEEIKRRDVSRAGYGPGDLQRFLDDANAAYAEVTAKIEADQAANVRHASRANRVQLNRAVHLMQQHSLEVNQ